MLSLSPAAVHDTRLNAYFAHPHVRAIGWNARAKHYTFKEHGVARRVPGLLRCLQYNYYPDFERKRRAKVRGRVHRASSKQDGLRVHDEVRQLTRDPSSIKREHRYTRALLDYWFGAGHELWAAELPLYLARFKCVTQADVITQDAQGRLWMWELKTGAPKRSNREEYLRGALRAVRSNVANHWELQRHFNHLGLRECGLEIHASRVLNVYYHAKKKAVVVKERKVPEWTQKL